MFQHLLARFPVVLLGTTALAALAQTAPNSETPVASPPGTPGYRSAFEGYQPFADEKPADWKASNEAVRQAGGWRAYAREAAASPRPDASSPRTPAGSTDPHSGHHKP